MQTSSARTGQRSRTTVAIVIAVVIALAVAGALARGGREPAAPAPTPTPTATFAPAPPPAPAEQSAAPSAPAPASPAAPAERRAAPARDAEEDAMAAIRAEVERDPARAIALADEADRSFPDGAHGDERSYLRARSLVNLGRIGAARDEATAFFRRHPDSPLGEDVWRLTGVQPRPAPHPE